MTVIAWDGVTLAADKLACFGPTKATVTKIFKRAEGLIGVTGTYSMGMEMIAWFDAGRKPEEFPAGNRSPDNGASLIWVKSDKTVWKFESSPYPFGFERTEAAFGNGDESALIAMACGKSAKEAVLLTSEYNATCGRGVDTLTLD